MSGEDIAAPNSLRGVLTYLKRLATAGAAYQAGDILSKGIAVFTLPLYTKYVSPAQYGAAQTLLVFVILVSIVLRFGLGEAFIRFYFDDEDRARRDGIAGATVLFVAATTTVAALVALAFASPLSQLLLGFHDATLMSVAILGMWAFTNLEIAYALLRAGERTRVYLRASVVNVLVSVSLTVWLVVFEHDGARGLLAGNYIGSTVVLLGLWWLERRRIASALRRVAPLPLRRMLHFGLPTVPADAGVYALQVVDRAYLFRYNAVWAGQYALAVQLATVVFVFVRGFQYAWPTVAYSVSSDEEAGRLYALVTTYYVLATGVVVAGVALLGRWFVRLFSHPRYYDAHEALPWLALGWALYGLYLVFVVISGRMRVTRRNLPPAAAGLAVNVIGIVVLVPAIGIAGAGIALCAAYVAMLVVMYLLTRGVFPVPFQWSRIARVVVILATVSVAGNLLLPTHGLAGFALRGLAWLLIWPLLHWSGFLGEAERETVARLARRGRSLMPF